MSWRFRVVDLHVFINGPPSCCEDVVETLEGAAGVLKDLDMQPDKDRYII